MCVCFFSCLSVSIPDAKLGASLTFFNIPCSQEMFSFSLSLSLSLSLALSLELFCQLLKHHCSQERDALFVRKRCSLSLSLCLAVSRSLKPVCHAASATSVSPPKRRCALLIFTYIYI